MYSLPPSAKNFLFATETITENHNQSKFRIREPSPKSYICKTIPATGSRNTVEEKKNCINQSISEFDYIP